MMKFNLIEGGMVWYLGAKNYIALLAYLDTKMDVRKFRAWQNVSTSLAPILCLITFGGHFAYGKTIYFIQ